MSPYVLYLNQSIYTPRKALAIGRISICQSATNVLLNLNVAVFSQPVKNHLKD